MFGQVSDACHAILTTPLISIDDVAASNGYTMAVIQNPWAMKLGVEGCCSLHTSASHRFHMVEPIIDQLLCVLPVGCILWHGLQRRQDLWVENPQTLREQQSSRLAWNKQKPSSSSVALGGVQQEYVNQLWRTITACSVTTQCTNPVCLRCSRSAAHLVWIVGHCQADQASRLQKKSKKEMLEKSAS